MDMAPTSHIYIYIFLTSHIYERDTYVPYTHCDADTRQRHVANPGMWNSSERRVILHCSKHHTTALTSLPARPPASLQTTHPHELSVPNVSHNPPRPPGRVSLQAAASPNPAAGRPSSGAGKEPTEKAGVQPPVPDDRSPAIQLKDKMCPLWGMPYGEQLKAKFATCWDAMVSLSLEIAQATLQAHRPEWISRLLTDHPSGHPCCSIDVRSPPPRSLPP